MKNVIVVAEFVNMVPAHKRYITRQGEGSTISIAIGRAVDAIFQDERVRGKRTTFPIKLVVSDCPKGDN